MAAPGRPPGISSRPLRMNRRLSPNAQGVALMTGGSLAYVINDGLVREATERGLDVYQSLFLCGCLMIVVLAVWAHRAGHRARDLRADAPARLRVGAEVVATVLLRGSSAWSSPTPRRF